MYVYIFVLVVDSILEMIKLVGIVVYNFIVLMCYSFWFYFWYIIVIIIGLIDLCKNVEWKCIYIVNVVFFVIVDFFKYRKWIYF